MRIDSSCTTSLLLKNVSLRISVAAHCVLAQPCKSLIAAYLKAIATIAALSKTYHLHSLSK